MPRLDVNRSGEMEIFARVFELGGFSAAARELRMTPSAVSKLVWRLETRLACSDLIEDVHADYPRMFSVVLKSYQSYEMLSKLEFLSNMRQVSHGSPVAYYEVKALGQ